MRSIEAESIDAVFSEREFEGFLFEYLMSILWEGMMKRTKFIRNFIVFLILISLCGFVFGQDESTEIIQKEHKRFYQVDSEIDFNAILELDKYRIQKILSITLHYHMAISSLSAQWLADDKGVKEIALPKGLNKSVTYTYNVRFPGKIALRLKGDRGQIQVTAVEAKVIKKIEDRGTDKTIMQMEKKTEIMKQAKYFEIISPAGGENWEMAKTVTIYWKSSGIGGELAMELFRNRNKIALISRNISVNKGFFQWKVSGKDVIPGGGYQVRLTTLTDGISYISKTFGISDEYEPLTLKKYTLARQTLELKQEVPTKPVSLRVLSPQYQDKWHLLQEYDIKWESEGLTKNDDIAIALKPISGKMAKIIGISKNTGEFTYHVPYPLIFIGFDIQVIITPLKNRSVEVLSDSFVIMRPMVDLIANNPTISYTQPQRRKKKWWQVIGDIFTGGITWYVNEVVEITKLNAEGTTMEVDVNVINKGLLTRKKVTVDCSIQTLWGNVLYSFDNQNIPAIYPDLPAPVRFSARTKGMNLEAGKYILEVLIDPDNKMGEQEPFRVNNKVTVEFEVK